MVARVDVSGPHPVLSSVVGFDEAALPALDFVDFYHDNRGRVARALSMTLADVDLAVEATDEAFVRAYQRWGRVAKLDNPGGWTYRVGLNWATSVLRRRGRAPSPPPDPNSFEPATMGEPDVMRALAELEIRPRAVVVCRYLLGWSEAETAAALRIPVGTVKSRLHRASRHLAARLEHLRPRSTDA